MSKTIPLRPANEQFTDSQWQAVFDGDENILVSASAGSGKTTVLVRRVIEKSKAASISIVSDCDVHRSRRP